jgi:hypothetical protein
MPISTPSGYGNGRRVQPKRSRPSLNLSFETSLSGFEIKTMAVDLATKDVFEVNLMERKLT